MRFRELVLAGVCAAGCAATRSAAQSLPPADLETYARVLAMADSRVLDTALVRGALAGRSPRLRAAASISIGQVGRRTGLSSAPTLRRLMRDSNPGVASSAAYALGLLVDTASVASLDSALRSDPRVAREAAWALGEIGGAAANGIVRALAGGSGDRALRIQLLLAAAKLRPLPVAALRPYLASPDGALVWPAAYAIARTRAPSGIRDLIALSDRIGPRGACIGCNPLGSSGPLAYVTPSVGFQRARAEIARALTRPAAGDSLAADAKRVLVILAKDPSPHVRINAIRSAATFGPWGEPIVTAATSDRDANVRIAAAQSAATVILAGDSLFAMLWRRDTSFMYRSSLLASASSARVRLPELVAWRQHRDWRYRASAGNAVIALRDTTAMRETAALLIADRDPRARTTGYSVLAATDTGLVSPAVRSVVVRALRDPNVDVRSTAIDALRGHASSADIEAIIASYELARRDASNDARLSAARVLAALWARDSAAFTPAARLHLGRIGAPSDPLEREAAGAGSVFSSWPAVTPAARPLDWYRDVVRTLVAPALAGSLPRVTLQTSRGPITIELFAADAPLTVNNFLTLARRGYYRGTRFHRVVPNFVAQDGDPDGTGSGGPGYAIRDEFNPRRYERGAVGMALSGPDTGGSQYFLTHSPQPHLDGHYTVFGHLVRGWAALDRLVQGDLISSVTIHR